MTIVVTGGGSGGHITPILAVAKELKRLRPEIEIVYIGQKGDVLLDIPTQDSNIDAVYSIRAGKFRRYHGEGWRQLLDVPTQVKNIRDGFLTIIGIWQGYWLLKKLQPKIIFTRGGFVSVPVALAGALRHIPYVTHDSDSTPSLANRIIARWAKLHAVALPEELYPYPPSKTKTVGVPINSDYVSVTPEILHRYRHDLELDSYKQILLVTGGGNGAVALNEAVIANSLFLLKRHPELAIIHFAGRSQEAAVSAGYDAAFSDVNLRKRVMVHGFSTDLYRYTGAADVIIARGGATNLAEFAVQRKACIIVPPPGLVWAIRNTEALAAQQAVIYLTDEQAAQEQRLGRAVSELLLDDAKRQALAETLGTFAHSDAARQLAVLLLEGI